MRSRWTNEAGEKLNYRWLRESAASESGISTIIEDVVHTKVNRQSLCLTLLHLPPTLSALFLLHTHIHRQDDVPIATVCSSSAERYATLPAMARAELLPPRLAKY